MSRRGRIEFGESQLPQTIEYVGADHFLFASDIPHWDCEFPGNLEHLRNHQLLSEDVKEKILFKDAKRLFSLLILKRKYSPSRVSAIRR